MALPKFTHDAICDYASSSSYYRGEDYFESDAVQNLKIVKDTYQATVLGTHRYTVKIWDDDGEVDMSCTCPYDWGGICKHIVAVMLAVLDQKNIKQDREQEEPPIDIDKKLASLSAAKLRAFIKTQVDEFPQIIENLQIFAQGDKATGKTDKAYEKDILKALRSGDYGDPYDRYHDYYDDNDDDDEYDSVSEILQSYFDAAEKYLSQNNWAESAKIGEAIFHAGSTFVQKHLDADDENVYSECETEIEKALGEWAKALSAAKPKAEKMPFLERLADAFAKDEEFIDPVHWQKAFQTAVKSATEAKDLGLGHTPQTRREDGCSRHYKSHCGISKYPRTERWQSAEFRIANTRSAWIC